MALDIKRTWWTHRLIVAAAASLIVAGAVYIGILLTQQRSGEHEATPLSYSTDPSQADETDVSSELVDSHRAAPNEPRLLNIPSLSISSRVFAMGIARDGSIQTPRGIYDTGWYSGASKPGEKGAVFIDGHVSGPNKPGVFKYLSKLKAGDTLELETGNATVFYYKVIHSETVSYRDVDMRKVLSPYGDSDEGLNLMTCTGRFDAAAHTFESRIIVYATRTH